MSSGPLFQGTPLKAAMAALREDLIHDDAPQIGQGYEQGRARTDNHLYFILITGHPGVKPFTGGHFTVEYGNRFSAHRTETGYGLRGQRNLSRWDYWLPAVASP